MNATVTVAGSVAAAALANASATQLTAIGNALEVAAASVLSINVRRLLFVSHVLPVCCLCLAFCFSSGLNFRALIAHQLDKECDLLQRFWHPLY